MLHVQHFDRVAAILEAHAIITEAEAEFGRIDSLQPLDIALFTQQKPCQPVQQVESGLTVTSARA